MVYEVSRWALAVPAPAPAASRKLAGGESFTNEAGEQAVWVTEVDIHSGTKGETEWAVRAPWLDPDASAELLHSEWQSSMFTGPSGVWLRLDIDGVFSVSRPDLKWAFAGSRKTTSFLIGDKVVVMRHMEDEASTYHVFLLP